jgi:hypothetical protein
LSNFHILVVKNKVWTSYWAGQPSHDCFVLAIFIRPRTIRRCLHIFSTFRWAHLTDLFEVLPFNLVQAITLDNYDNQNNRGASANQIPN